MIHTINRNPSAPEIRKFGVTILIGMGVVGALLWWLSAKGSNGLAWSGRGSQWVAVALWGVGGVVAILSRYLPAAGRPIYVIWMSAAAAIGFVTLPIFLTILYFVLLPVFSLIRLKDPLRLKLKRGQSYWEPHTSVEPTIERMQRPF